MPADFKSARQEIELDIREGQFTPFLGAGASSLRSNEVHIDLYPWCDVAKTISAIAAELTTERSLQFLRSFAQQRLRISDDDIGRVVPASANQPPIVDPALGGNGLVRLQVALVRATVRLTHYFGNWVAEQTPSIYQLTDCSVPFKAQSDEGRDALLCLFEAVDVASRLQEADKALRESPFRVEVTGANRCLQWQRLYYKLFALTVGLIGRDRPIYQEHLSKHLARKGVWVPDEVWDGTSDDFGEVRLDAIQWMSELIWYTLRYWVPSYPTTSELAFEFSLAVRDAPPRRAELAQAAQALENNDSRNLAKEVRDLIAYCERGGEYSGHKSNRERTTAFYYGIAAAMQFQYEMYLKEIRRQEEAQEKVETASTSRREFFSRGTSDGDAAPEVTVPIALKGVPPPVIFTTNFDGALEKIFLKTDLSYHVVYPILRSGSIAGGEQKGGQPSWMIRTCYPESEGKAPKDRPWDRICDDNGLPSITFCGPMIVKLHGSPTLQRASESDEHWLVLSERGYLQALGQTSNTPIWLSEQLRSTPTYGNYRGRSLWFLGYSISDWNVRLQLYEHCRHGGGARRSTVDRVGDIYRTAILGNLNIRHWKGDLNYLPSMILRTLEDEELEKSPKLAVLICKLRDLL